MQSIIVVIPLLFGLMKPPLFALPLAPDIAICSLIYTVFAFSTRPSKGSKSGLSKGNLNSWASIAAVHLGFLLVLALIVFGLHFSDRYLPNWINFGRGLTGVDLLSIGAMLLLKPIETRFICRGTEQEQVQ